MRTALVGAVESTRIALETLVAGGHAPLALFTLPPDRSARHSDYVDLAPAAARLALDLVHTSNVNDPDIVGRLRGLELDYLFVIGWSQLCSHELLSSPHKGVIGFHPSALPENRGRAVIPWTIIQGRDRTGSSLLWIDDGIDSGDILAQQTFAVAPDETAASLYRKHMAALGTMLHQCIEPLAAGTAPRTAQDHSRASWCARRTMRDGWIDWNRPARDVWTLIRAAGEPYPGAFTTMRGGKLIIWAADFVGPAPFYGLPGQVQTVSDDGALVACGDGEHVLLKTVQLGNGTKGLLMSDLRSHVRLGVDMWDLYQMNQP